MNTPETIRTAREYTLPMSKPLPKFSMIAKKMGATHQQWFNSYLERRSLYITEASEKGRIPTVSEFHTTLVAKMDANPGHISRLARVSGAIQSVVEPGNKRKATEGLSTTSPISLTEEGSDMVLGRLRELDKTPYAVEVREERISSQAELVGRFILDNNFKILDPATGTVINPHTLGEFEHRAPIATE
jgi:hypothetical protein